LLYFLIPIVVFLLVIAVILNLQRYKLHNQYLLDNFLYNDGYTKRFVIIRTLVAQGVLIFIVWLISFLY
jgi:hypothetical protein